MGQTKERPPVTIRKLLFIMLESCRPSPRPEMINARFGPTFLTRLE
jgi:hypothetical protein